MDSIEYPTPNRDPNWHFAQGVQLYAEKPRLARQHFSFAAQQGHAEAMFNLAVMAYLGQGGARHHIGARILFGRAADLCGQNGIQVMAHAQLLEAEMCHDGQGGDVDLDRALELVEKAANQDLHAALYKAGVWRLETDSPDFDLEIGINWLAKVAPFEIEDSVERLNEARLKLADRLLIIGHPAAALQEIVLVAKTGSPNGCELLGHCFERGIGTPQNPVEAVAWYRRAAEGFAAGNHAEMHASVTQAIRGLEEQYPEAIKPTGLKGGLRDFLAVSSVFHRHTYG